VKEGEKSTGTCGRIGDRRKVASYSTEGKKEKKGGTNNGPNGNGLEGKKLNPQRICVAFVCPSSKKGGGGG